MDVNLSFVANNNAYIDVYTNGVNYIYNNNNN